MLQWSQLEAWRVRHDAMKALGRLEPETLAQHADAVLVGLDDSDSGVRAAALKAMGKLEPVTLAQYADSVVARLEGPFGHVRKVALNTLAKLEPATLAQHAGAVVARLEDSLSERLAALETLAKVEPMTLAQHAGTVVARLEDPSSQVRAMACYTLQMLPRYVRYATRGVDCKEYQSRALYQFFRCRNALQMLPRYVHYATRGVDCKEYQSRALYHGEVVELRSRLLGRVAWYRCRIRLRVRSLSLYWYALPYQPSGPGHARDVEAWSHMIEE